MDRQRSLVNYFFLFFSLISLLFLIFPSTRFSYSARLLSGYLLKPDFNYLSRYEKVLKLVPSRVKALLESDIRNRKLEEKVRKLEIDLLNLKNLRNENDRLRDMMSFPKHAYNEGIFANVISRNPANPYHSFFINKGSRQFIKEGYPVVGFSRGSYALVGRIFDVYSEYSKVILVNNPQLSFIGAVGSQGIDALVRGANSDRLSIDYINAKREVKLGDEVMTSPSSITFPPGLPVGRIDEVYKGSSSMNFYGASAAQGVSIDNLNEVYVIKYEPPIKIEEEEPRL